MIYVFHLKDTLPYQYLIKHDPDRITVRVAMDYLEDIGLTMYTDFAWNSINIYPAIPGYCAMCLKEPLSDEHITEFMLRFG